MQEAPKRLSRIANPAASADPANRRLRSLRNALLAGGDRQITSKSAEPCFSALRAITWRWISLAPSKMR